MIEQLALSVVALVSALRGQGAAVELEIELARPFGQPARTLDFLFKVVIEVYCKLLLDLRTAGDALCHAVTHFEHIAGRSAAAVSVAEGAEILFVEILLRVPVPAAEDVLGIEIGVVCSLPAVAFVEAVGARREVGENLRAVDALPHECVIGHFVELVPGYLCGHEIVNSGFLHDLRESRTVAENIGEPHYLVVNAELVLEEALADQELADKGFAGGDVGVRFDPHAALDFPAPCGDHLLDALIDLGIVLLDKGIELSLRGHELVFGIFLHELEDGRKGAAGLLSCLAESPEPCDIYMRVADAAGGRVHGVF